MISTNDIKSVESIVCYESDQTQQPVKDLQASTFFDPKENEKSLEEEEEKDDTPGLGFEEDDHMDDLRDRGMSPFPAK